MEQFAGMMYLLKVYYHIVIDKLMRVRGKVRVTIPETPFHVDFNELLCILIALTLTEIVLDCGHT